MYENLDEFMKTLETIQKTTAIYLKITKEKREGNLYVGGISVQYLNEGHIHAYLVKDIISVQLIPDALFVALKYYATEDTINRIAENYASGLKEFNDKLTDERNNIINIFKQNGFLNILNVGLM
jgi:hypothetical protein